jgi:hypothetical protein
LESSEVSSGVESLQPTQTAAISIGFVLLSHQQPDQLLRLVQTLNRLYDNPPMACHHDDSQAALDRSQFPPNLKFVSPSLRTGWAKWSVVEGALRALRLIYAEDGPDWFTILSAADYPIARAKDVRHELQKAECDAFIDFREVGDGPEDAARYGPRNPELWMSETKHGRKLGWDRYLRAQLWIPVPKWKPGGGLRLGRLFGYYNFQAPNCPFNKRFRCFHGDFWFCGNARVARTLLNPPRRIRRLARYLKARMFPEECYFQTVLCNADGLTLNRDNKRFAIWVEGAWHPALLRSNELERIIGSGAHFGRKFAPDSDALDALDEVLDGESRTS